MPFLVLKLSLELSLIFSAESSLRGIRQIFPKIFENLEPMPSMIPFLFKIMKSD